MWCVGNTVCIPTTAVFKPRCVLFLTSPQVWTLHSRLSGCSLCWSLIKLLRLCQPVSPLPPYLLLTGTLPFGDWYWWGRLWGSAKGYSFAHVPLVNMNSPQSDLSLLSLHMPFAVVMGIGPFCQSARPLDFALNQHNLSKHLKIESCVMKLKVIPIHTKSDWVAKDPSLKLSKLSNVNNDSCSRQYVQQGSPVSRVTVGRATHCLFKSIPVKEVWRKHEFRRWIFWLAIYYNCQRERLSHEVDNMLLKASLLCSRHPEGHDLWPRGQIHSSQLFT